MTTLPITTSKAIVIAGQVFMRQVKQQIGGTTSPLLSEKLHRIDLFKKHES